MIISVTLSNQMRTRAHHQDQSPVSSDTHDAHSCASAKSEHSSIDTRAHRCALGSLDKGERRERV